MVVKQWDVKAELKQFIQDQFLASGVGEALGSSTKLLDEQIIDSSGVLVLIMHVERLFQISIDDAELVPDNFESIDSLAQLIEAKLP